MTTRLAFALIIVVASWPSVAPAVSGFELLRDCESSAAVAASQRVAFAKHRLANVVVALGEDPQAMNKAFCLGFVDGISRFAENRSRQTHVYA